MNAEYKDARGKFEAGVAKSLQKHKEREGALYNGEEVFRSKDFTELTILNLLIT